MQSSGIFKRFVTTNSNPTLTARLPQDDGFFVVLDLFEQILGDLD
jgi:hypothetical protein